MNTQTAPFDNENTVLNGGGERPPYAGEYDPQLEPHQRILRDEEVTIVNRAKGEVMPFSPISKNASTTTTGNVTGYGIEIRDESVENGWRLAGNVGKNYLLVDNREVVRVAEEILSESPFAAVPRKVFFDGKRFIYSAVVEREKIEAARGEDIAFGIQFRNSYNGSMKFRAELYAERLTCANGMTTKRHFAEHTFQHTIGNQGWEQDLREAMAVVKSAPDRLEAFGRDLEQMDRTGLTLADVMAMRSRPEGLGNLPNSRFGEVFDQLTEEVGDRGLEGDGDATVYDLLNASSQVLWHRDRSVTDLEYNEGVVDQLIDFTNEHRN